MDTTLTGSITALTTYTPSFTQIPDSFPTNKPCFPNIIPNFDTSNLTGIVCAISTPPSTLDLSSCCMDKGSLNVLEDCTQYCEVKEDEREFGKCARALGFEVGSGKGSIWCMDAGSGNIFGNGSGNGTANGNGTDVDGDGDEDDLEGAAARVKAWGYAVAILAVGVSFGTVAL